MVGHKQKWLTDSRLYLQPKICSKLHTHLPNSLLDISIQMSRSHLKHTSNILTQQPSLPHPLLMQSWFQHAPSSLDVSLPYPNIRLTTHFHCFYLNFSLVSSCPSFYSLPTSCVTSTTTQKLISLPSFLSFSNVPHTLNARGIYLKTNWII